MCCLIAELRKKKKPFAVIISNEIKGTLYSIVYKDCYIRVMDMNGIEINYFLDMRKEMEFIGRHEIGSIWEYKNFKRQMSSSTKHNFLIRHQIIKGEYI
jgi:hypothetical protein